MVSFMGGLGYAEDLDRKSTRLNSSHLVNSYAVFCVKKKNLLAGGLEALLDLLAAHAERAVHALELGADRVGSRANAPDAVPEGRGGFGHEGFPVGAH